MPMRKAVLTCLLLACLFPLRSSGDSIDSELATAFGDAEFLSIVTGSRQSVTRAPAVASVITADEIEAMGATDLSEVLEAVLDYMFQ